MGRFNLISVAFIPLFVGLGVDFGIQFAVKYRAETRVLADPDDAIVAAARDVGASLALAAAAIAAGFFAFLPTSYVGVSELGVIAGVGILWPSCSTSPSCPPCCTCCTRRWGARGAGSNSCSRWTR